MTFALVTKADCCIEQVFFCFETVFSPATTTKKKGTKIDLLFHDLLALSSVNSLFHSFLLCKDESDRLLEVGFVVGGFFGVFGFFFLRSPGIELEV